MPLRLAIARLAMMACGALVGAYTLQVVRDGVNFSLSEGSRSGSAVLLGAGGALTLAAAVTVSRSGRRVVAVLLLLTGLAWFVQEWGNPAASNPAFTIGLCLATAVPAVVLAVAVASASRLRGRSARIVVAAGFAVMVGVQGLAVTATFDPQAFGCAHCPANLLAFTHDPDTWGRASGLGVRTGMGWLLLAILLLAVWLLRASGIERRATGWFVFAALTFLILELIRFARSVDDGILRSDATAERLWRWQGLALMSLAIAAIADRIRVRRSQRALARVVSGLALGDDLRASLARRLGDPQLIIGYPSYEGTGHLDATGVPIELVESAGRSLTRVDRDGALLATVLHRTDVAPAHVQELAVAAHLALDHQRLQAQALAQLAELRRSGARLVATGDAERQRLERDLHDGAQQSLVTLLLGARMALATDPANTTLTEVEDLLQTSVDGVRSIAHGLFPVLLAHRGLTPAMKALAETRALQIEALPDGRLHPLIESTVFALVEVASQASPTQVSVTVEGDTAVLQLSVQGDCPDLESATDRITALSGTISTASVLGHTTLTARLPCKPAS